MATFSIANNLQMLNNITMRETSQMFLALAPNTQVQPYRQGINHRNAHTVQAAGNFVGVVVKLTAGVELGHDNFRSRNSLFFVHADRNTTAVVANGCGTVRIKNNFGLITITGQSLINGVIQHLIYHMMKTRAVVRVTNVHSRTLTHRIKSF